MVMDRQIRRMSMCVETGMPLARAAAKVVLDRTCGRPEATAELKQSPPAAAMSQGPPITEAELQKIVEREERRAKQAWLRPEQEELARKIEASRGNSDRGL